MVSVFFGDGGSCGSTILWWADVSRLGREQLAAHWELGQLCRSPPPQNGSARLTGSLVGVAMAAHGVRAIG